MSIISSFSAVRQRQGREPHGKSLEGTRASVYSPLHRSSEGQFPVLTIGIPCAIVCTGDGGERVSTVIATSNCQRVCFMRASMYMFEAVKGTTGAENIGHREQLDV